MLYDSFAPLISRLFIAVLPIKFGILGAIEDRDKNRRVICTENYDSLWGHIDRERDEILYIVPNCFEPMYLQPPGYPGWSNTYRNARDRDPIVVDIALDNMERVKREIRGSNGDPAL